VSKKQTKSKLFNDVTLAYGLIKRMNGFAFCHTGDQELVRLGYLLPSSDKLVRPYLTIKGKKFLMEAVKPFAEDIPEDKPKEDDKEKKDKVNALVKNLQNTPVRGYWEPDEDDEDEDDEEDFVKKEKKEKPENDSQA
jgi:hypothetical protein